MKQRTSEFAAKFKHSYTCKMGGSQTIELPNGQQFGFDDKQYYRGRGAKYNSRISHDEKGLILVTRKQFSAALKAERERKVRIKEVVSQRAADAKRYADNAAAGIYGVRASQYGTFIELSDDESQGKYFEVSRLAKTLNISVADAGLLNSRGKTYVFAKDLTGKVVELYHPSLTCNNLSITISYPSSEYIETFDHYEWENAPYAKLLGQTENKNHFVC